MFSSVRGYSPFLLLHGVTDSFPTSVKLRSGCPGEERCLSALREHPAVATSILHLPKEPSETP